MMDADQDINERSTDPTTEFRASLTEDQLRERLVDRFNWLGAKIADYRSIVAGLAALEGELARVDAALAALNGDHAVVPVDAEPWACDVCERAFSTRRGLSRHVHAAHTVDRTTTTTYPITVEVSDA